MQGGWDPTFVFDPKPGSKIVAQAPGDIATKSGLRYWSHASRPKVDAFFEARAGASIVVNGISVRSFAHLECTRRILAGDLATNGRDMAAAFGHVGAAQSQSAVPYLVLGDAAIAGPYASDSVQLGAINQVSALLRESANQGVDAAALYGDPGVRLDDAASAAIASYLSQRGEQSRAPAGYKDSLARYQSLQEFATRSGGLGELGFAQPLSAQREIAVAALSQGFAQAVFMQSSGWDTHVNNDQQGQMFDDLFGELTLLGQQLESAGVWEKTTVLVVSEMGRTPALNSTAGKDHWPFTSSLLFGGGLQGGRVLGATDDSQRPLAIDFRTGLPNASGDWLQHDNFYNGVLDLLGVDASEKLVSAASFAALRSA